MQTSDVSAMPLMLFAAGFGTRMRELTRDKPKPLVPVAGQVLIDHALTIADEARAQPIVVNLHYRGDQIRTHLANRRDILFSDESALILETGGGLRKAAGLLATDAVMTLNTDAVWTGPNPLRQLLSAWQPAKMDCLLLLLPKESATGHKGNGDFELAADGKIGRGTGRETHIYLGAQIIKTSQLEQFEQAVFSLNLAWNQAIAAGRAFGVVHSGGWCDVGQPESITMAEALLREWPR